MTTENSIGETLQINFQREKLSRAIKECEDINVLKSLALELLKVEQKKSTISQLLQKIAVTVEVQSIGNDSPDFNKLKDGNDKVFPAET